MAQERLAALLLPLNQPCYFVCFSALFVTYFVHNVAATVSYEQQSDRKDILQTHEQAHIPVIYRRKKLRFCERRAGCLVRIRRRLANLPLPFVLLANLFSLENKRDEIKARISYQWDIKN